MRLFARFPDGSFRAHNATVIADVFFGRLSSVWFNVVIRGDIAPVTIGQRVNIQDGAIIHVDNGIPNVIEDDVSIGHAAIIHGARVGRGSLIGMRATLLSQTQIGSECLVAAGAVVSPRTVIPDRHMAMGVPARVIRPLTDEELAYLRYVSEHYVELAEAYVAGKYRSSTLAPQPQTP